MKKIKLQAHRGVSTDYPENTMSAFRGAVEQGYDIIELDPAVTADGEIIIMHDSTLNRTGRTVNGEPLPPDKKVIETDYSEIQGYEFGGWFNEKFAGEKAPLMQDVLAFAEETGILLKIDNKFERFEPVAMEKFLNMLKGSTARIAFTCAKLDTIKALKGQFPAAEFHYDGVVTEEILQELNAVVGRDKLTVWLPYKNENTTWVKIAFINSELAELVKKYADLGLWILSKEEEYLEAEKYGVNVIETTGSIKPRD